MALLLAISLATSVALQIRVTRRTQALEVANQSLIATERQLNDIIESQSDAIVIVGGDGLVRFANGQAEHYFGKRPEDLVGKAFGSPIVAGETTEIDIPKPDRSILCAEMRASPIRFRNDPCTIVSIRDITERKAIEQQLVEAQKMEVVGQLAGGIAHDFNNTHTVVLVNLELAGELLDDNDIAREHIEMAHAAGKKGVEITKRLLTVGRRQQLEPEVLNPNEIITETNTLMLSSLGSHITVDLRLAQDAPPVFVDRGQLENALLNLCINARDAMAKGGRIVIETASVTINDDEARVSNGLRPGRYATVAVHDNGTGMPRELQARVLEPFFSTKAKGKGTGLGLAMVHGFVKQSGGDIAIDSVEGEGTTFTLYFPTADRYAPSVSEASIVANSAATSATILLVEDEPEVMRVTMRQLEPLGYFVLPAVSASQAIAQLELHRDIDLVLTDFSLGIGETGLDVVRHVRDQHLPAAVVLMSADLTQAKEEESDGKLTDLFWLAKPFTKDELAARLQEALEAKSTREGQPLAY